MPAPPLTNTFEGGSNTTGITTGNSGGASGDAFNTVDSAPGPTFSSTQAKSGSLSMRVQNSTSRDGVRWTGLGSITGDVWYRTYLNLTANPSTQMYVLGSFTNASGNSGFIVIEPGGTISARNGSAVQVSGTIGSVAVPLNTWFRLEARIRSNGASSQIEWKMWSSPESTGTPTDSGNGTDTLGANTDQALFGQTATIAVTVTAYFDDLKIDTAGWIGPSVVSSPGPTLRVLRSPYRLN